MADREQNKLLRNLMDAGCPEEMTHQFMNETKWERKLAVLSRYRKLLLENIHGQQKKLDCLDYLIYCMKKEQSEMKEHINAK